VAKDEAFAAIQGIQILGLRKVAQSQNKRLMVYRLAEINKLIFSGVMEQCVGLITDRYHKI